MTERDSSASLQGRYLAMPQDYKVSGGFRLGSRISLAGVWAKALSMQLERSKISLYM